MTARFTTYHTKSPNNFRSQVKIGTFIFFISLFMGACFRSPITEKIIVPPNAVLASYDRYLVIQKPYTRVYSRRNENSDVLYILRKGNIVEIEKSSGTDEQGFFWYRVKFNTKNKDVSEERNENMIRGWVLLLSPIRTSSLEKAQFLSQDLTSAE